MGGQNNKMGMPTQMGGQNNKMGMPAQMGGQNNKMGMPTQMGGGKRRRGTRKNNNVMAGGKRRRGTRKNNNVMAGGKRRRGTRKNNSQMGGQNNKMGMPAQMGGAHRAVGSHAAVWHGSAHHTSGGLTKKDLMKNKHGRIISKKKHALGKKALKHLVKAGFKAKKGTFKLFRK
jgi:hypothetical protein